MAPAQIRSAALSNYVDVARSLGVDPYVELKAAGLDVRSLTQPDLKIPVQRVIALLESSALAAGVDDFGLRMALMRRLSNLGLIALAVREQPTVREALLCLQRTIHLHNEAMDFEIEEANDVVVVRARMLARVQGPMRQATELAIAVLYRALNEFLGEGWMPRAVCFMHSRPGDLRHYRKAFNCSVQFDSVLDGITCRSRDLERAMPRADPQSLRVIQQVIDRAGEREETYAMRTTRLILGLLPGGRCTADFVAGYLGVDRRTLHRRLAREQTSFSKLLDDVRAEAARRHLIDSDQAIADLAPTLGFSDASALSRWFSGRFGCSPRAWRSGRRSPTAAPRRA